MPLVRHLPPSTKVPFSWSALFLKIVIIAAALFVPAVGRVAGPCWCHVSVYPVYLYGTMEYHRYGSILKDIEYTCDSPKPYYWAVERNEYLGGFVSIQEPGVPNARLGTEGLQQNVFSCRSNDDNGNFIYYTGNYSYTVDNTPPQLTITDTLPHELLATKGTFRGDVVVSTREPITISGTVSDAGGGPPVINVRMVVYDDGGFNAVDPTFRVGESTSDFARVFDDFYHPTSSTTSSGGAWSFTLSTSELQGGGTRYIALSASDFVGNRTWASDRAFPGYSGYLYNLDPNLMLTFRIDARPPQVQFLGAKIDDADPSRYVVSGMATDNIELRRVLIKVVDSQGAILGETNYAVQGSTWMPWSLGIPVSDLWPWDFYTVEMSAWDSVGSVSISTAGFSFVAPVEEIAEGGVCLNIHASDAVTFQPLTESVFRIPYAQGRPFDICATVVHPQTGTDKTGFDTNGLASRDFFKSKNGGFVVTNVGKPGAGRSPCNGNNQFIVTVTSTLDTKCVADDVLEARVRSTCFGTLLGSIDGTISVPTSVAGAIAPVSAILPKGGHQYADITYGNWIGDVYKIVPGGLSGMDLTDLTLYEQWGVQIETSWRRPICARSRVIQTGSRLLCTFSNATGTSCTSGRPTLDYIGVYETTYPQYPCGGSARQIFEIGKCKFAHEVLRAADERGEVITTYPAAL